MGYMRVGMEYGMENGDRCVGLTFVVRYIGLGAGLGRIYAGLGTDVKPT